MTSDEAYAMLTAPIIAIAPPVRSAALWAVLALNAIIPSQVAAKPATTDAWTGGPVKDNGRLVYCGIEAKYDNGLTLALGRNAAGETTVIVGFPKAAPLPAGTLAPVALQVDATPPRRRDALALTSGMLTVKLGRDDDFLAAFGSGSILTVTGPTDAAAFSLAGSTQAIAQLAACSAPATR